MLIKMIFTKDGRYGKTQGSDTCCYDCCHELVCLMADKMNNLFGGKNIEASITVECEHFMEAKQ
jgi:hypothetical protein